MKPHDPTSEYEAQIEKEAEAHNRRLEEDAKVLNRPIGSQPISDEDQLQDYLVRRADPLAVEEFYQQMAQTKGPYQAWWDLLDYAEKMEKLLVQKSGR